MWGAGLSSQQFFRFIFLKRNWASDRKNLSLALTRLGKEARSGIEAAHADGSSEGQDAAESSSLMKKASGKKRSPLWLLIFPEGTITSDEERVKSLKYATKEGVDDFVTVLHPRSTGLLFCLRTLLPQIPDLQLLDVTIGYPGVPLGAYPQDYYSLGPIFFRSVPPPAIHLHLHLHSNLSSPNSGIPSLLIPDEPPAPTDAKATVLADRALPSKDEARAFELWLREVWTQKDERMKGFFKTQRFVSGEGGEGAVEVVPIKEQKWYHVIAAFGGGGVGTLVVVGVVAWQIAVAAVGR